VKELLKARFAMVRRDLENTLSGVSDDMFTWSPAEGMRTIQGLLFEIAGKEVELLEYAKAGGREEWVEVQDFGGREASLEGMKELLRELRQATLDYIDSMSDDDLNAPVAFPTDWWEGLGQAEIPLHEVLRNVAAHEWYHTGQLVTYLWLRGDDPYSPKS
jgi:uncharacterized damage-inducible protein DinB